MREIKFRAWDKKRNKMFYTSPEVNPKNCGNLIYCDMENIAIGLDGTLYLVDECGNYAYSEAIYEIMQFTGLKDKNGKEIYEGDVCNYTFDASHCQQLQVYSCNFNSVVKYYAGKGCFVLERLDEKTYALFERFKDKQDDESNTKLEVIGNIYENPELLERSNL